MLRVPAALDGERVDRILVALLPDLSRTVARRWIDGHHVQVAGQALRPASRLATGTEISVAPPPPEPSDRIEPEAIELDVVYEDAHLVVIDKPAGMVVHPGAGRRQGTLVAALLARYGALPEAGDRPGIVHRLDRNTSGLLVVARTATAMRRLAAQIAARQVHRGYRALVWGTPRPATGVIETRITRSRRDRRRMAPSRERGRPAATEYRVLESWGMVSLLDLTLRTGRTHQIRVHLSWRGHAVLGDPDYGGRQKGLLGLPVPERRRGKALLGLIDRQALHAERLAFAHPVHGERLAFTAPLPADFEACCAALRGATR
jgi:23S rRNA pseudouridine1911/1915/1917 synthase